jgi:hypothetical protein
MNLHYSRKAGFLGLIGLGMVLALGPVGCGGPFTGEVSGTVKYKGEPLPGGIVTISHPDGRNAKGQIREDGTYSIKNAPGGEVKVTVHMEKPIQPLPSFIPLSKAGGKDAAKAEAVYPSGKYVKIPEKYANPDASGLKLEVKRGSQEFPIELKD